MNVYVYVCSTRILETELISDLSYIRFIQQIHICIHNTDICIILSKVKQFLLFISQKIVPVTMLQLTVSLYL